MALRWEFSHRDESTLGRFEMRFGMGIANACNGSVRFGLGKWLAGYGLENSGSENRTDGQTDTVWFPFFERSGMIPSALHPYIPQRAPLRSPILVFFLRG